MRKTASDYKYEIEKKAGVEWGFEVGKDTTGNMGKRYKELSDRDGYDLNDDEIDELDDIEFSFDGARSYGYPDRWSEKGIAQIPLEYAPQSRLANLMNNNPQKYLRAVTPLNGYYSGAPDGERFLTDRDGANQVVNMFDEVISKLPEERTFNREAYDSASKKYDEIIGQKRDITSDYANKIAPVSQRSTELANQLNNTGLFRFNKRRQLKNDVNAAKKELSALQTQKDRALSALPDSQPYYDTMMKGTDRDIMELYRDSLKSSLNNKDNNLYHMRWH